MLNGHVRSNGAPLASSEANAADGEAWARQFLPPPLLLKDTERARKIEAALADLMLDGAVLRRVARVFEAEVEAGLRRRPSSLQMENTYVPELPNGTEEGVFLALDLGGTNFRILLIELEGGRLLREDVKQYHISDGLRLGAGAALFEFLAECVHDFLRAEGLERDELSLGFTFSFPMRHHSISSGELITWTKSFNCSGMEGVDVAALLQRCLRARDLRVTVRVLLNDTTGTLVAGALKDPDCAIAVILGTGSNGCYLEKNSNVVWETPSAGSDEDVDVVVDVEWGAFGDNGCLDFLRTELDELVDSSSLLAGSFTFEKYIGGKYLGDVAAAALQRLHRRRLLPAAPPRLGHGERGTLLSHHLSTFEEENEAGETAQTQEILRDVCGGGGGEVVWSAEDARVAQHVARVVTTRAAQLVSVCISHLLRRVRRAGAAGGAACSVAVDGSVYKRHPRLRALMRKHIALLAPHHPFRLVSAEDGSGKGSALTAAIAARLAARTH